MDNIAGNFAGQVWRRLSQLERAKDLVRSPGGQHFWNELRGTSFNKLHRTGGRGGVRFGCFVQLPKGPALTGSHLTQGLGLGCVVQDLQPMFVKEAKFH